MDILSLLLEHQLPTSRPASVLAGPGEGLPCGVCRQCISTAEVQYEFEVTEPPWLDGPMRMHLPCFRSWQAAQAAPAVEETRGAPAHRGARHATLRFLLTELEVAWELLAIERGTHLLPIALRSRQRAQEIYLRVLSIAARFSLHIEDPPLLIDRLNELRRALDRPGDCLPRGSAVPRPRSPRAHDGPGSPIRLRA